MLLSKNNPLTQRDVAKRGTVEKLLVVKLCRAKGEGDPRAKKYYPGETIAISGEGKMQLLAMQVVDRDLNRDLGLDEVEKTADEIDKKDYKKLSWNDLQKYAVDLGLDIKGKTKNQILKELNANQ